ncbi:hypothetical protein OPV22_014426 [Ensete ventricosum]|uniref:Pentacotripeptide-repeat region of PRORP domain-containing protein n=1 Tax=Ensete ventricosum TaxID=4639 RepID=A0AAV8R1K4_ENSVE|nr:hypothetical protein OPV22_014426 [Ensete ventricosum]
MSRARIPAGRDRLVAVINRSSPAQKRCLACKHSASFPTTDAPTKPGKRAPSISRKGATADHRTLIGLIDSFLHAKNLKSAFSAVGLMFKSGHAADAFLLNLLMKGLCNGRSVSKAACKTGDLEFAKDLFADMLHRGITPDLVTYSVLINRLAESGKLGEAMEVLEGMKAKGLSPDVVVYDSLIRQFGAKGETSKIIDLLHEMAANDVALDAKFVSTILDTLPFDGEDKVLLENLPNFSKEISEGTNFSSFANALFLSRTSYMVFPTNAAFDTLSLEFTVHDEPYRCPSLNQESFMHQETLMSNWRTEMLLTSYWIQMQEAAVVG